MPAGRVSLTPQIHPASSPAGIASFLHVSHRLPMVTCHTYSVIPANASDSTAPSGSPTSRAAKGRISPESFLLRRRFTSKERALFEQRDELGHVGRGRG